MSDTADTLSRQQQRDRLETTIRTGRTGTDEAHDHAARAGLVVPPLVNPTIDRWTNSGLAAGSPIERRYVEQRAHEVMEHREGLVAPTVVLARNQPGPFDGYDAALGLELTERGASIRYASWLWRIFHEDRIVDRDTVQSGLILVLESGAEAERPPGELIGEVDTTAGFAIDTLPSGGVLGMHVYLLDRQELLGYASTAELGNRT